MNKALLRPAFTQDLADTLLAGKHVNLVSPHGRGRRQTLLDLESLLDGVNVRRVDLKREQDKWQSWLEETLSLNGQVVIIIHNFDFLNNTEVDKGVMRLYACENMTLLAVIEDKKNDSLLQAEHITIPK